MTPEFWYYAKGRLIPPCKSCQKAADKARRAAARAPAKVGEAGLTNLPAPSMDKAIRRAGEADAAEVFQTGAAILKRHVAGVLARLVKYAADPKSPHHWDSIKLLAERGLPVRAYSVIGGDQATGKGAGAGPNIQINILPAQTPAGPVVEVQAIPEQPDS
jgi:hypothetical protein